MYKEGTYSCPFAMNVIRAEMSGGDLSHVYSPTTGRYYAVTCMSPGGRLSCVTNPQQGLIFATP